MSSPPNGRALPFPLVWGNGREDSPAASHVQEGRSPSDEELMTWIQGKDHQALDELYVRYSRLVFGIALRVLNDKSEAEEVVQEVFLLFLVMHSFAVIERLLGCFYPVPQFFVPAFIQQSSLLPLL